MELMVQEEVIQAGMEVEDADKGMGVILAPGEGAGDPTGTHLLALQVLIGEAEESC